MSTRCPGSDSYATVPLDAAVCNSAIWQTDLSATTAAVRSLLATGGSFVFKLSEPGCPFLSSPGTTCPA